MQALFGRDAQLTRSGLVVGCPPPDGLRPQGFTPVLLCTPDPTHTALEPLSLSYLQPPTWRVLCAGTWFVSADNINNATAWLSEWFSFLVEFTDNPSSEMISSPLLPLLTFLVLVEHMAAIPTIVQTLSSRLYNEHAPHIFTLSSPS